MSMIEIPKEELDQLEAAIREKDRTIAEQKINLETREGYRLFNAIQFASAGIMISKLVRKINRIALFPPDTPEEAARLTRLADLDEMVVKQETDLKKATDAWNTYLLNYPHVDKILVGEYELKIPQLPAEVA